MKKILSFAPPEGGDADFNKEAAALLKSIQKKLTKVPDAQSLELKLKAVIALEKKAASLDTEDSLDYNECRSVLGDLSEVMNSVVGLKEQSGDKLQSLVKPLMRSVKRVPFESESKLNLTPFRVLLSLLTLAALLQADSPDVYAFYQRTDRTVRFQVPDSVQNYLWGNKPIGMSFSQVKATTMIYSNTKPITLKSPTASVTLRKGSEFSVQANVLHVGTQRFNMNPALKAALNVKAEDSASAAWSALNAKVRSIKAAPSAEQFSPLFLRMKTLVSAARSGKQKAMTELGSLVDKLVALPAQKVVHPKETAFLMNTVRTGMTISAGSQPHPNDLIDPLSWMMLASLLNSNMKKAVVFARTLDEGSQNELSDSLRQMLGLKDGGKSTKASVKALNVTSADVLKVGDLVEFPFGIDKSKGRGKIVSGPHAPTPGDEFIKTKYFKIKGTSPKGTFDIETRRCKKVASSTAAATLSSKDIDALDNPAGLTDTLASAFRVALKKNMDFISKDVSKIEMSDPDEDPSMKLFLNSHSSSMDRAQVQRLASAMKDIESVAHKGDSLFFTELHIQSKGSYLLVVFP